KHPSNTAPRSDGVDRDFRRRAWSSNDALNLTACRRSAVSSFRFREPISRFGGLVLSGEIITPKTLTARCRTLEGLAPNRRGPRGSAVNRGLRLSASTAEIPGAQGQTAAVGRALRARCF